MDDAVHEKVQEGDAELSYENALLLIEEFEEVIDDLEAAEAPAAEAEDDAHDLVDRLLSSLDDIPITSEMTRERLRNVESWARVLLSEDEDDAGSGSIPSLLRDELAELRGLLEYELTA